MSRLVTTLKFLLIISFLELISVGIYASTTTTCNDGENYTCSDGQTYSCDYGKCITDQTTQSMEEVTAQCAEIEDEDEKQSCFDSVAKGAVAEDGFTNEQYSEDAAKSAEMLGWANLIWGALIGEMNTSCYSTQIMKWTGYAQTAGELYQYFVLADKVSDIQEEYSNRNTEENDYDAQYEAFNYLVQEQETIADVSKQKKMIYTVAAAGYTAAAGAAIIESAMVLAGKDQNCWTESNGTPLSCNTVTGKSDETKEKQERAEANQANDAQKAQANADVNKDSDVVEAQGAVDKTKTDIQSKKDLLASAESDTEIAAINKEIEKLEGVLEGQEATLATTKASVATKLRDDAQTRVDSNTKLSSDAEKNVAATKKSITATEKEISAAETQIKQDQAIIEASKGESGPLANTKISEAEARIEAANAKIKTANTQLEGQVAQLDEATKVLKGYQDGLDSAKGELAGFEAAKAQADYNVATQTDSLSSQVSDAQGKVDKATDSFNKQEDVKAAQSRIEDNEKIIAKSDTIINNPESSTNQIADAKTAKLKASGDIELAQGEIDSLKAQTDIASLTNKANSLESTIDAAGKTGAEMSFIDQTRYDINDPNIGFMEQAKNSGMNELKSIFTDADGKFTAVNISRYANDTLTKANSKSTKQAFKSLPSTTQSSLTYDLKLAVNKAESLELDMLNHVGSSDYISKATTLMNMWKDIADKASSIGDEETTERATDLVQKWAAIIQAKSSYNFSKSEAIEVYSLFTKKTYNFRKLHTLNILLGDIKQAESDLDAYIAFRDWQRFNVGKLNSLSITDYNDFLKIAPRNVYPNSAMRDALYEVVKYRILTNDAYAAESAGSKIGNLAKGMALGALKTYALKFALCTLSKPAAEAVSTALQTPYATAVMASATAYVNFQLRDVAAKEQEQAEKNAEIVRAVMAKFKESQIKNCPDGRNDETNPNCYCYTEDGSQSGHTKSDICQNLWASDEKDWFKEAGEYGNNGSGGCVYLNGQYDLDCDCKNLVDSNSGTNACMKNPVTSQSGLSSVSFPQFASTSGEIGEIVSSAASGNLSNGALTAASVLNAAKAQKNLNEQMVDKVNKAIANSGGTPIDLESEAARAYIKSSTIPSSAASQLRAAIAKDNAAGKSAMSNDAKAALEEAMKSSGVKYSKDSSTGSTGQTKSAFNFLSGNSSSKKGAKSLKFMDKKYNYKNNDINTNKGASIFDIISNRYNKSGLKRVFGD